MITIPTVLVLGAGASIPYKFPSSRELVNNIKNIINPYSNSLDAVRLKKMGHFEDSLIIDFHKSLRFSNISSIDVFLEYRPKFIEIGKLAIACSLIPCEKEDNLFFMDNDKRRWYEYLFSKMLVLPVENFKQNKLSIITFNYDRSIDHYLFTAIKNAYNLEDFACSELMKSIPIVHVHGRLGMLPWQGEPSRPYSSICDYKCFRRASEQIKIINEGNEDSIEFREAHKLIHRAKRIFFLGFGYNPTNLRRLKLDKFRYNFYYTFQFLKELCGTTMGIGKTELQLITPRMFFAPNSFGIIDFFREFKNLK